MASTSYAATEEMTNINRVSRLLMGPCTDQLRDLLRLYIPPGSFPSVIQKEKNRLPPLTEPQRKLILPNSGVYSGNYDDMDISLLYILLRNVCRIQIQAHNRGWGNTPESADRSVSANIERLRLARNQCGHSLGGMCYTEFNQIWSEIKATVVDLDKALLNGNKYQYIVDSIRNDTMDPVRDKHYRDQLHEQMKEIEKVIEEVNSLKSSQEGIHNRMLVMENGNIPPNIKEQHKTDLDSWQIEDSVFHEIHSFQSILQRVKSQPVTTIIGGPGSGKTTTARHLALRLHTDCGFEIVPVLSVSEVIQYGHPKSKQLFVLDDVIGVFGVEYEKLTNLERYKERIFKILGELSKILFTCRKAVYNESSKYKSFVFKKKYLFDLEDNNYRLSAEDRKQILNNHLNKNALSLRPNELPNVSSTSGTMMYPLLCKLFCSKSKYRSLGMDFFENPYICIRKEMGHLQGHKQIQYASLVLCMLCKNEITKSMISKSDSKFMEAKEKVFENCGVIGRNSEIKDALDNMINTFTIRTNDGYSLIHDAVYEVLASHYGNKHQEDMLEYMSSSFVANKFIIKDISDDIGNLHIKIHEKHYRAFAERIVRDLKNLELHDVFMNKALKFPCICSALIDELKKLSYNEIKKLFFQKKPKYDKYHRKHFEVDEMDWDRQCLLYDGNWMDVNTRLISWVISYGHKELLRFLFDQVAEHQESIRRVMGLEIPDVSGNGYKSNLNEQCRFLTLSCYSGDVDVVKILLKHCDAECINISLLYGRTSPLAAACGVGHMPVVEELIRHGASIDGQEYSLPLIHVASQGGNVDVVDYLIKCGVDCNQSDNDGRTPILAASQRGHVDVVDYLIKCGVNCHQSDKYGRTPILAASQPGHVDVVDLLIKCGVDCNQRDKHGRTPILAASQRGHVDVVDYLIKCGVDCNQSDEYGRTPILAASQSGHVDVVDYLIKCGVDCNQRDEDGRTPILEASEAGHVDVVDYLIKCGVDCNQSDEDGRTPILEASEAGHVDVVDYLIKCGVDCNQRDEDGSTPIHAASRGGNVDVVDSLIKCGVDCNQSDNDGRTPIHRASFFGHVDVVDVLIKCGVDCNQRDKYGRTPIHAASEFGRVDVVDLLIKCGVDCNQRDKHGRTPILAASQQGHVAVVDYLIKCGVDCNQRDKYGRTPILAASQGGHVDVVDYLIKCGVNCHQSDGYGRTPIHAASELGYVDVVDLLIKCGVDCNQSDKDGRTPLHAASEAGHGKLKNLWFCVWNTDYESTVRALIGSGADINQSDINGESPLFAAMKYKQQTIAELLFDHGAKSKQIKRTKSF
ncbi:uncharacterized protein LOC111107014 isoform X2 [Crassostrea virginica]